MELPSGKLPLVTVTGSSWSNIYSVQQKVMPPEKKSFPTFESNIEIHWAVSLSIDGEPKMSLTAKKKFESCVASGH